MGYLLSSLAALPLDDSVKFYLFVVGDGMPDRRMDSLRASFDAIAQNIGSDAVIARGFNERLWSDQLMAKYFGTMAYEVHANLPAILVTNDHPDELSDWSLRVLIPLKLAEEQFGDIETFFRALVRFARGEDGSLLDKVRRKDRTAAALNEIIKVKPGLLGVNIDLNAFVDRFFRLRA